MLTKLNAAIRDRRGFTLLELLVVMVILVMLAGAVTLAVVRRVEEAKHAKAITDVETLGDALDQFYLHCGRYPTSDEGLNALRIRPDSDDLVKWDGPYIKKAVPADPWGTDYVYVCPGEHNPDSYDLYTLGRDGRESGTGSDADVTNWDQQE